MIVYFGVLAFLLLVCFLFPNGKKGLKLFLCLTPVFIMMALREDWGGDYENYEQMFDYFKEMNFQQLLNDENRNEIGFRLLVYISPTFRHLLVITSLIICVGLYYFFYNLIKEKYWPLMFIFIFIDKYALFGDIAGIRNGIAVVFFLASVHQLIKNNRVWAGILLVIAGLSHSSALFLLPIIFLRNRQLKLSSTGILISFGIFIFFAAIMPNSWVTAIDFFFSEIDSFSKYAYYIEDITSIKYSQGTSIILAVFMLYIIAKTTQLPNLTEKDNVILKLSFLWFVIRFTPSIGLTDRLFFYADYLLFSASTVVLSKYPNRTLRIVYTIGLTSYFLFYFYIFTTTEHFMEHWVQYNSCLK